MTTDTAREVEIPRTLTVMELAALLDRSPIGVIKALMTNGVMAEITKTIDYDTAAIVAVDLGFDPVEGLADVVEEPGAAAAQQDLFTEEPDAEDTLTPRAPIVAVLGHVDHGKTTLLDAIRRTSVTADEAGGITQHIGAYQAIPRGKPITFLDTPGHEAFTAMRARGAQATDIAILVVAANDGVMPQTKEAIDHIRAAGVPLIVALNKIDVDNINVDRVKAQLSNAQVMIEEYGGDIPLVPVSATTKQGLDDLLETVLLVSEVQDYKANGRRPAAGIVLEAALDRRRGSRTTLLVQRGTLRQGDSLLVGATWGRVKAMFDFTGARVQIAGPSTPVSILGVQDLAAAGDRFRVLKNDKAAKRLYEQAKRAREAVEAQRQHAASLDALFGEISQGEVKELKPRAQDRCRWQRGAAAPEPGAPDQRGSAREGDPRRPRRDHRIRRQPGGRGEGHRAGLPGGHGAGGAQAGGLRADRDPSLRDHLPAHRTGGGRGRRHAGTGRRGRGRCPRRGAAGLPHPPDRQHRRGPLRRRQYSPRPGGCACSAPARM